MNACPDAATHRRASVPALGTAPSGPTCQQPGTRHRPPTRGRTGPLTEAQQDLGRRVGTSRQSRRARRPWSARISVTSSAYSRSPPTGSPRAIRVTARRPAGSRRSARLHRSGLALEGRDSWLDHLPDGAPSRWASSLVEELADPEAVRSDPIDGRDRPVENVVETLNSPVRSRARTSSGSSTTHSRRWSRPGSRQRAHNAPVADVETPVTEDDLLANGDQRSRQRPRLGVGARRRWNVSRWAVFGPIPGRRANASMRRARVR